MTQKREILIKTLTRVLLWFIICFGIPFYRHMDFKYSIPMQVVLYVSIYCWGEYT